jgi:hypothetical protein
MTKRTTKSGKHLPSPPIALVCVSRHEGAGPLGKEPDKLTMIRGKWAWCPSGAEAGHDWQAVAPGSLNALRVQLVEVSRLVDVALNGTAAPKKARSATKRPRSRRTQR